MKRCPMARTLATAVSAAEGRMIFGGGGPLTMVETVHRRVRR